MAHVLGYTILNNVCARDIEADRGQMTLARNFDTFCAMGPFIVTADELSAPDRIGLRVFVNGQLWRSGQTADWPSPLPRLLSWLSQRLTLDPGDIVSTGLSPHPGPVQAPRSFLKPGDVVRLEADGIGVLENPVVE
jgi:2-keto-4-pentenoate hydratase/2-oxohepta-3-ene-1,7-dioic acid hydratase in catechol pathway